MSGSGDETGDGAVAALVVRRVIHADPHRLFAAWTSPQHLTRWWGPEGVNCPEADVDLKVGGRYRLANRMPDGRIQWIAGTFETIEPPRLLVYSWCLGETLTEQERVTVRFEPRGQATEVIIRHERMSTPAIRRSHLEGWRGCLDSLEAYLGER